MHRELRQAYDREMTAAAEHYRAPLYRDLSWVIF